MILSKSSLGQLVKYYFTLMIFSIWNFVFFCRDILAKIQYFLKVLQTDCEIQYFFNTFNTAWEPCKLFRSERLKIQANEHRYGEF